MDRTSVSHLRWTLTVDGRSYAGFQSVTHADHDLPTGTHTPAGSKGDVGTVGTARQGGDYVFTKKYNRSEWPRLKNPRHPGGASAVCHEVDDEGRILATVMRTTGILKGATTAGQQAESGDPLNIMIRYRADGELG